MSNQVVFDKVAQLIANRFSVDASTVTEGMTFQQDLGADSLDVVELVMELEDEFGIQISDEVFYNPQHPYTWGLLRSMPTLHTGDTLYAIPGSPPDLLDPPKGDAFALRSDVALEIDRIKEPPMFQVSKTHFAATWLLDPRAPKVEVPEEIIRRRKIFFGEGGASND